VRRESPPRVSLALRLGFHISKRRSVFCVMLMMPVLPDDGVTRPLAALSCCDSCHASGLAVTPAVSSGAAPSTRRRSRYVSVDTAS